MASKAAIAPSTLGHVMGHADRGAALFVYVVMMLAPFLAGAPLTIAGTVAAARLSTPDPITRSHFQYQLRTMGKDVVLAFIGALAAIGAIACGLGEFLNLTGFPEFHFINPLVTFLVGAGLALIWAFTWIWAILSLFLTPLVGALRLAANQPAPKRRV